MSTTTSTPVERGCLLDVVNEDTPFPNGFELLPFADGKVWSAIRYAGGCGNITVDVVAAMPGYFIEGHRGIEDLIAFSGGTMQIEEVTTDGRTEYKLKGFMITAVPRTLKAAYPGKVKAVSTTPRTAQMTLDPRFGGLVMTDSLDRIDYKQDRAIVIQKDATEVAEADWSKDVLPYLKLMKRWMAKGVKCAVVAVNGGGVTAKEINWALEQGIPVIAVRGSGRKTDEFITAFEAGTARIRDLASGDEVAVNPALVSIVSFDNVAGYRNVLIERGFIKSDAA